MKSNFSGFSFIELMLSLSLLAFLVLNSNLPGFSDKKQKISIEGIMTDIISAVAMSRQAAVSEGKMVTFCRSDVAAGGS